MKMKKGQFKIIGEGAKVAGGFAIAQIATSKVAFLQSNPWVSAGAKIIGAMIVGGMSKAAQGFALGIAANGVVDGIKAASPDTASQLGLAGLPSPSTNVHRLAGRNNGRYYPPAVVID